MFDLTSFSLSHIEVADDGEGFDGRLPDPGQPSDPGAERGRGLRLVLLLVDEVTVRSGERGTVARCRRSRHGPRRHPPIQ